MTFEQILKELKKHNSAAELAGHFSRIYMADAWAMEILACAVEVRTKADLARLGETLSANCEALRSAYAQDERRLGRDFYDAVLETVGQDCVCRSFKPALVKEALRLGLYPMSISLWNTDFLTVRHHSTKLLVRFENFRVPKNVPRYIRNDFSGCTMTFNRDFGACVAAINAAYRETWLCPPLVRAFGQIHAAPTKYVSVDSVEIWRGGRLVAGEIGFITGNVYASLSGFHLEPNIGTVQMALLGLFLKRAGFAYWDLGMSIPYKYRFGAEDCDRATQELLWQARRRSRLALPAEEMNLPDLWEKLVGGR